MSLFGKVSKPRAAGMAAPSDPVDPVAITGIGFSSPVGASAWQAALALRKGRSNFCSHEIVLVAEDRYRTTLRGATISRIPEDTLSPLVEGVERAVALLAPAVRECLSGLPRELTVAVHLDGAPVSSDAAAFHLQLIAALPDVSIPEAAAERSLVLHPSRCAFFERIIHAAERLRQGPPGEARHLVGCVDSLCSVQRLTELCEAGSLKSATNPEGIVAGEAAGAILLERASDARRRGAPILATIASGGRGADPNPGATGFTPLGMGLTQAFQEAFSPLDDGGKGVGMVISDLNGERGRALDWAYAEPRLFSPAEREPVLKHPADTLGDCGCAMGAALILSALAAVIPHRRGPPRVALCTTDDAGASRVIVIEAADAAERRAVIDRMRGHCGKRLI